MKDLLIKRFGPRLFTLGWIFLALTCNAFAQGTPDLDSLNKSVETLYNEGKYQEALPISLKALKVSEESFGPDHTNTATCLNNLAELYDSLADYVKAEPLYQRALKIREKALGPEHPDTATMLNNL